MSTGAKQPIFPPDSPSPLAEDSKLPKMRNPMPPPPLTDEGNQWRNYHFNQVDKTKEIYSFQSKFYNSIILLLITILTALITFFLLNIKQIQQLF